MVDVVIAGKNNIAVDAVQSLMSRDDIRHIYAVVNSNDDGIDKFQKSFKGFCLRNEIKIISLKEAEQLDDIIFISLEFDKIINVDKFKSVLLYNIHFSLLPKYKGMYTSAWPIINNEPKSGVTLHKIDAGIDTGDIIDQIDFNLDDDETAKSLYFKYIHHGTNLILKNISKLIKNKITKEKQGVSNSSYYSRSSINYRNIEIDLNKTAIEIKNQINAYTFRDFQLVKVNDNFIFGCETTQNKSNIKPGEVLKNTESYFEVSSIDYNVKLYKDTFQDLLSSCKTGDVNKFEKSINKFNKFEKNDRGWSPIIVAAYNGNLSIVKRLVDLGASVNDTNHNGTTVLMYAKDFSLANNDLELIDFLVRKGANPAAKDIYGKNIYSYLSNEQVKFFSPHF